MNLIEKLKEKVIGLYLKLNEFHLSALVVMIATVVIYLATSDPNGNTYLNEIANRLVKLATFLVMSFSTIKLFGTAGLDIKKEIIEDQNEALAKLISAIIIGIAACLLL